MGTAETDDFFGTEVVTGDFNNDRFDDLAISVLLEDIGAATTAGAVNVIYGSAAGLTAAGNQLWHQDSPGVQGTSETGDRLGRALATGDFAGNGFDDLAIGVPEEHIGATEDAGVVNVLYGSATGLTAAGNQLWQQDSTGIEDTAEEGDFFGWSVASGDFDGDGFDELAVGVEREGFDFAPGAGAVNIIHGSAGGLTATGNQFWHQDSDGILDSVEPSDFFGGDVTGGDFDGDGFDDLAVGADQEDIVDVERAGAVSVLYGSGDGLTAAGNQFWHQDSDGIEDTAEAQDQFGSDMAGGDFDDDGFADLAVGVREEDIGGAQNAGAVNVLYGAATVHTPTATPTETVPGTPTSTQTPTPTETVAVAPTSTRTPTPTETVAVAPTSTRTPTPTETVAVAPTATRTPTPTETVAGSTPGDVDCNSTTDAIDAALILQLDVGLINSLACPENGDLSGDGAINSIDAAIVLQCDAGLFDCTSLAGRRG